MARLNDVLLIGNVVNERLEPKIVGKHQTDGENPTVVLNFLITVFDEDLNRFINLTVAVWGEEMVDQCLTHINQNDIVSVKGELRYKHIWNHKTQQNERIYTNVKASSIEFLTKKFGTQDLDFYENKAYLCGNLASDPQETADGYVVVVAVDRLYPTKEATAPNSELTDWVTVIFTDKSVIKGEAKQGASVIIDGKLMTRKRRYDVVEPRIVVAVNKMVAKPKEEVIEELVLGEEAVLEEVVYEMVDEKTLNEAAYETVDKVVGA